MLKLDAAERIKKIDRDIVLTGIIDAPGSLLVGLGLYAKFAANGDAFHPLLNNQDVVNLMLAVGGAILIWGGVRSVSLVLEKGRLKRDFDL
ncbi:MAG TPA: hypothetical protein DCF45_10320 [Gammaproteobacteria bacterium]|nr:hypothetical protein [Gammaproteobacteria bacterium]